jgi:hypothetical protein
MRLMLIASMLAMTLATPVGAAAPAASDDTLASLAATASPPWNPPQPIPSRRPWEQVLLFPGRVVSLPLVGLGKAAERGLAYAEGKGWVPTGPAFHPQGGARHIGISSPHMGGRAGFGASLELRQPLFSGALANRLAVRYADTFRHYNGQFVTVTGRPLELSFGNTWRPQERFYGLGTGTTTSNESDYASRQQWVRLEAASVALPDPVTPANTRVSTWIETRYQVTRSGDEPGVRSFETVFPSLAASTLDREVEHLVYGVGVLNDARAGDRHWTHGLRLLASAERHDRPVKGLALRVGEPSGAQYNRFVLEGETGASFGRTPRTLRILGRVIDQQVTASPDLMLLSDLATLGGTQGLAGYHQGRFRDTDALLLKTSYILPVSRRLELDLHSEWGSVYPDVWRDASLSSLHNTFGVALRGSYITGPVAAVGLDWSPEGVRLSYTFGRVE